MRTLESLVISAIAIIVLISVVLLLSWLMIKIAESEYFEYFLIGAVVLAIVILWLNFFSLLI